MIIPSCFPFSIRLADVALAAILLLGACNKDAASDTKVVQQAVDPNLVTAQPTLMQRLEVASVGRQPIAERLHVPGQTTFNGQRVARVGTTATGCVTELVTTLRQSVKAGDILVQLHSTELGVTQLAYQEAAAQHDLQTRTLERAKSLLAADAIGLAGLQGRQNELAMTDTEVHAAADQLRVMGMSPDTLVKMHTSGMSSISPVVASIGSTVVERKMIHGQVVQPTNELLTVADLSRVWVVGEMSENVTAGVQAGQAVKIDTGAGDHTVDKLIWVLGVIDPQTRTVTMRTEVNDAGYTPRPSVLATLFIQSRSEERVVVPTFAVVHEDSHGYIFVHTNETSYQLTPVKLGDKLSGVRPVISDVQADQLIVAEGSFHLSNKRKHAEMKGA